MRSEIFSSLEETGTALHQEEMSSTLKSEKSDNILNDSGNGQALMNSAYHNTSTTVKSKVDFIYGAVPSRSKNDILLVLQSCDYNVDAAISIFSQGRADDILNQWSHSGKKSKDGNKKKRNKKKQGSVNAQDVVTLRAGEEKNPGEQLLVDNAQPSVVQITPLPEPAKPQVPTNLSLNTANSETDSSQELKVNGISTLSSNSSASSEPVTPSDEPAMLPIKQKDHQNHSSSHHHHKTNKHNHHPKTEKLSPSTGIDALKKTTKDLSRSSFSLGRYHLVLEEECEQSFKRMTKTFENIRNCIDEREATLNKALKEFKEEAAKLLQQRAEDAAALKLKTERVQSMSEEQIALLRADIKKFVAERKIDEELAQTKRFICDEENFLQGIKTFGEVVPIKSTYSPVILNHPTPSAATPKPSSSKMQTSLVNHPSETKLPVTTQSANVVKTSEAPALPKSSEPQTTSSVATSSVTTSSVTTSSVTSTQHTTSVTAGRPPKIESLISSAMAKTSVAVANLQDATEIHSKLNEDVEKQGVVSQDEAKKENPSQEHKQSHPRPTTAPHPHPAKQQHKRTQESRPRRPQTSRQGNRTNQRQNKDEKTSDKLNETSQTEARAKTSQRGSSGQNEKRKEGSEENHKSTEGRQSNPPREGGSKRPPRRRRRSGRENKAKLNGEEAAKDGPEVSADKESGQSANEDRHVEQTEKKEEKNSERGRKEAKGENNSTDRALPQRSPTSQNRRRFRGREKERSAEAATQQINGASNGLANHHANGEEEKAEIAGKDEKIAKLTAVVDQPLVNGHNGGHDEKTVKEESRDEVTEKENIEINGFAASNGNVDDCMVGR